MNRFLVALLLALGATVAHGSNGLPASVNSLGMKMISLPPGSFVMGAETNQFTLGPRNPESKDAPSWDETRSRMNQEFIRVE
jgi:hypothetical protein